MTTPNIVELIEAVASAAVAHDNSTAEYSPGVYGLCNRAADALHEAKARLLIAIVKERDEVAEASLHLHAYLDAADCKLTGVRNALTDAGLPDWEPVPVEDGLPEYERAKRAGGRVLDVVERIRRLHADRDQLKARLDELMQAGSMACEEPAAGCQCAGCSYAREMGGS